MDIDNPYAESLLMYLAPEDHLGGAGYLDLRPWAEREELDLLTALKIASLLEQAGYIQVHSLVHDHHPSAVTPKGATAARRLRALREDRSARLQHTADALLSWKFENQYAHPGGFLTDRRSYFAGQPVSVQDWQMAQQYLTGHGLLEVVLHGVRVTALGMDCVTKFGGSVSDYLNSRPHNGGGGPIYNVHQPQGSIIGGEHTNVTQNNSFGLTPELLGQLQQFAGLVHQIAPVLGLPQDEQQKLVGEAQELADEAQAATPEPGRVRKAFEKVRVGITGATQVTTAATLLAVEADKLNHALGPLF